MNRVLSPINKNKAAGLRLNMSQNQEKVFFNQSAANFLENNDDDEDSGG